ncbi:MAG: hypothetical protein GF400_07455, partial [Candidatus Eisenbacteria bacterium]|nr:hypothetical protein [Candidatus Eisenbacteria bacterium]
MLTARRCIRISLLALLLAVLPFAASLSHGAPPEGAPYPTARGIEFNGWWHEANRLLLHTSNLGFFGDFGVDDMHSASWPYDSGYEHLYVAGLWFGAVVEGDTLVSSTAYNMEIMPPDGPTYTIYETAHGAAGGDKNVDDDGDGEVDEDRLDGLDNDGDLLIDEDFAAISDEMFAYVSYDTAALLYPNPNDPHTPIGMELYTQSYAWSDAGAGDFVGARYEATNNACTTLQDVYMGILADPDVGFAAGGASYYLDDHVGFVDTLVADYPTVEPIRVAMIYGYDAPGGDDGNWNGWFGIVLLDHSGSAGLPSPRAVRLWESGADDPDHDVDRYSFMSETGVSGYGGYAADWRFMMSVGPLGDLCPGESAHVDVAFVCGDKLEGLIDNAARALLRHRSRLWSGRTGPMPRGPRMALEPPTERAGKETRTALFPPAPNPATDGARI